MADDKHEPHTPQSPPPPDSELERQKTPGEQIQHYMVVHEYGPEHPGFVATVDHALNVVAHGVASAAGEALSWPGRVLSYPWRHWHDGPYVPRGYYRDYYDSPYGMRGGDQPYHPMGERHHEQRHEPHGYYRPPYHPPHHHPAWHGHDHYRNFEGPLDYRYHGGPHGYYGAGPYTRDHPIPPHSGHPLGWEWPWHREEVPPAPPPFIAPDPTPYLPSPGPEPVKPAHAWPIHFHWPVTFGYGE